MAAKHIEHHASQVHAKSEHVKNVCFQNDGWRTVDAMAPRFNATAKKISTVRDGHVHANHSKIQKESMHVCKNKKHYIKRSVI